MTHLLYLRLNLTVCIVISIENLTLSFSITVNSLLMKIILLLFLSSFWRLIRLLVFKNWLWVCDFTVFKKIYRRIICSFCTVIIFLILEILLLHLLRRIKFLLLWLLAVIIIILRHSRLIRWYCFVIWR